MFPACFLVVNPLTPMSDQDEISPYNINTNYQVDKWWELRKILSRGLLLDPIPNSPNWPHNYMADIKENY